MAKIIYSESANEALKNVAIYIATESASVELALNVISRMRSRVKKRLEVFPYSGQFVTNVNGVEYFKIIVERYSFIYKIIDAEDDEEVVVTNVIHEKKVR